MHDTVRFLYLIIFSRYFLLQITKLKIDNNPFARAFREPGAKGLENEFSVENTETLLNLITPFLMQKLKNSREYISGPMLRQHLDMYIEMICFRLHILSSVVNCFFLNSCFIIIIIICFF
jgi:hypothetical protein